MGTVTTMQTHSCSQLELRKHTPSFMAQGRIPFCYCCGWQAPLEESSCAAAFPRASLPAPKGSQNAFIGVLLLILEL